MDSLTDEKRTVLSWNSQCIIRHIFVTYPAKVAWSDAQMADRAASGSYPGEMTVRQQTAFLAAAGGTVSAWITRTESQKREGEKSMASGRKKKVRPGKQKFSLALMWRQRYLLLMSVPFLVWLIIFKYIPLWGWTMAFQDVRPATFALSFFEREFIGFENFAKVFSDRLFKQTMINTLCISFIGIALNTVTSILFAVLLNELMFTRFKKFTQTISYLPHFVSWVIIASIAKNFFNDSGVIDTIVGTNLQLMSKNSPRIWLVYSLIDVWKEMGWNAIIYLSAIVGIDQGLYEAAKVDGANRFQRIWHITLPGIRPTIVVLLIMSIGSVLNVGMERQMLLSVPAVEKYTMVLSWFSYKRGIGNSNYGVGTAIGMFQSLVGITLLLIANKIASLVGEDKLI